ncbi:MAG: hypothetical protein ACK5Q5_17615 [Planctomycetaceae bacterium]
MFFRFAVVVIALLALAIAGVAIEKRKLELQREIILQEYQRQQLLERRSRLQLEIERLSAPQRFADGTEPFARRR